MVPAGAVRPSRGHRDRHRLGGKRLVEPLARYPRSPGGSAPTISRVKSVTTSPSSNCAGSKARRIIRCPNASSTSSTARADLQGPGRIDPAADLGVLLDIRKVVGCRRADVGAGRDRGADFVEKRPEPPKPVEGRIAQEQLAAQDHLLRLRPTDVPLDRIPGAAGPIHHSGRLETHLPHDPLGHRRVKQRKERVVACVTVPGRGNLGVEDASLEERGLMSEIEFLDRCRAGLEGPEMNDQLHSALPSPNHVDTHDGAYPSIV